MDDDLGFLSEFNLLSSSVKLKNWHKVILQAICVEYMAICVLLSSNIFM